MADPKKKLTLPKFIGIVFAAPAFIIAMAHHHFMDINLQSMGLNDLSQVLVCILFGAIAGVFFYEGNIKDFILIRVIAGASGGALIIWMFGFYLNLRGNPDSMLQLELMIPAILAVLPGLILYKLVAKK